MGDRTVFLRRGKGTSDTVNVCDADNRVSKYEWKVRVFKPRTVTENDLARFNDVPSMIEWLKNQPDVVVEKSDVNHPRVSPSEKSHCYPKPLTMQPAIRGCRKRNGWSNTLWNNSLTR